MGQVNGPLCMEESSASLFDEYFPLLSEFHYPPLFPNKPMKPMLFLKFFDLFAERRLADSQYLCSSREVQLFSQNDCGVQVARVNVGEHCSEPRLRIW